MSNIYVDINLNSSENLNAGPRHLTRQIIRSTPVLEKAEDYSVVVSRLVLNSALLPIWIPQLKNIQSYKTYPNETVYDVGLTAYITDTHSGGVTTYQGSAPVIFEPTRPIQPPTGKLLPSGDYEVNQPKSAYCHVYDVGQIVEMFNKAFLNAFIGLNIQLQSTQWAADHPTLFQELEAPYFQYDFSQQNMKILAKPYALFQNVSDTDLQPYPYMTIEISFSAQCYTLLQGFYCKYNNLNTLRSTPFDIILKPISSANQQQALYLTQSGTSSLGPLYSVGAPFNFAGNSKDIIFNESENVPTIAVWQQSYQSAAWTNLSAVQSIQLITDLSTRQELVDDANQSQSASSSQSSILCDFFPDNLQGGAMSSVIVYNSPTIDNGRVIKLQSVGALMSFSISAFFVDFMGNKFPLMVTDSTRPNTIKLCFIKKSN